VLDKALLDAVLDRALSRGADFAELFAEDSREFAFNYVDRVPRRMIRGHDRGAGLRLFFGTRQVYAHTSDLSRERLLGLAETAAAAGSGGKARGGRKLPRLKPAEIIAVEIPPSSAEAREHLDFARRADQAARAVGPEVVQVTVSVSWTEKEVLVAASDGLHAGESRSYLMGSIEAIAAEGAERQSGRKVLSSRTGLAEFRKFSAEQTARESAELAVRMVRAPYAPAGRMAVIIGNDFGGVIFHEACGHSLETTAVAKGASAFAGSLGKAVAAECLTAVDDGTVAGKWGTTAFDDEGRPTERTVLIERGVLKSFMVDRMGALKTGYRPTGSGRRQSYRFAPTSRMRNTYIAAGRDKVADMIASTDYGLYAKKMGGGSVNPATGEFNFAVLEGYLIKKGKIAGAVRGASLIGFGPEVIKKVTMVGDDLVMDTGSCGSISGWVPTTVGQPSIKVAEITVGGRSS
jgi:TldD protein